MQAVRARIFLFLVLILAVGTFFTGLNWGLPSRESDPILFGGRQPWTGRQIMDLAGAWEEDGPRGADIAMHPLPGKRDQPIELNATDAQRSEIVRRFRLYSAQPDEMITFRALSRMKPSNLDLDPRLYQYGGLWIYPIGLLLKVGSALHLITLRTDLAFYLDHPDAFARFYLVARAYSAAWGLLGVVVIYAIGRDWRGKVSTGITAAAVFASMPVVIDLAHEAKPHLAGAVLVLLTIWCVMKFHRDGKSRWWILAGVCAGASMGMVLTAYVSFLVLGGFLVCRQIPWRRRVQIVFSSGIVGIVTVMLANPYLFYNYLFRSQVLHSNVGNYGTFYQPHFSWTGMLIAGRAIVDGCSPGLTAIGVLGSVIVLTDYVGCLLLAPAALVLIQLVLLADGKTAEYGRFGLVLDAALVLFAAALVDRLKFSPRERAMGSALLIASTLYFGIRYDLNFHLDNRNDSTRRVAAQQIEKYKWQANTIAVWAEPAPYCLPPVDLFHWRLTLLPRGAAASGGMVSVRPIDEQETSPSEARRITFDPEQERALSPISWANKPFEILVR
jgi:hypothetical protein